MSHDSAEERFDTLLASMHEQLGVAVYDGLMGGGGPPELHDPDRALGRLLAGVHRQTGAAVGQRLARRRKKKLAGEQPAAPEGCGQGGGTMLMRRPAAVRLKYREQALDMARTYWPQDLVQILRDAVDFVQDLVVHLEEDSLPTGSCQRLTQVGASIGQVLALPESPQFPVALAGYDYLETVESDLSPCALRLMSEVRNAQQLLESELVPHLLAAEVSWLGALEVAQDLADDLDLAHREATALSAAVKAVEEVSTDFRGADLRSVDLEGVDLEGIRWDAATVWPAEWEKRIWKASLAAESDRGVLIVGTEPRDSTVPADL
ncbi:hypothetical protein J7E87_32270 [Streptomyces sp. ISL-1]|uniref:hypothetical protein n=1 Tax=Streptomyces sp. ISL-1 TaxID=2817657 RepID=UPI001BEA8F99|nr:hypothetical protein [Streptomyces sp. ISL-1]MBT2393962.1 hypothetical protein [Streptomyces sp. ISL-1]